MLPAGHRLRRSPDFTEVVRGAGSVRSGGRRLVVHLNRRRAGRWPRVGFVVSKSVGNAVVRNRTKRVLRHLMAERLHRLTLGTAGDCVDVVVRAHPAAAGVPTAELAADLDRGLDAALRKLARTEARTGARTEAGDPVGTTREVR